jgi:hypothetical protein
MATFLINTAINTAIAYGLSLAFRRNQTVDNGLAYDDIETAVATRGTFLPILFGTQKLMPIFGWAGNRKTVVKKEETGGKGGGGKTTVKTNVYYESAWHMLCLGPAKKITRILENGKVLYDEEITAATTPSGSTISLGEEGSFVVYWGDTTPAAHPELNAALGINSRWPHVCYIYWIEKKLGTAPHWGRLEYVVTSELDVAPTSVSCSKFHNDGVNGAHIINQLLTAPYPYGCGIPATDINISSLNTIGAILESEGLSFNFVIENGQTIQEALSTLLQHIGCFVIDDGYRMAFKILRTGETVYALSDDVVSTPEPEIEVAAIYNKPNKIVFVYPDKTNGYKATDIQSPDDSLYNLHKFTTVRLDYVTSHIAASIIANRRELEEVSGNTVYRIAGQRDARKLRPGHMIEIQGLGQLRVLDVFLKDTSGEVDVHAMFDCYSTTQSNFLRPAPVVYNNVDDPDEDYRFALYELPNQLSAGVAVALLRTRKHGQIAGTNLWLSADNLSYQLVDSLSTTVPSGTLQTQILSTANTIIDSGITINLSPIDADRILDLSGDENGWRTGRQLVVIGDEIFFLKGVQALGGNAYELLGLIRARYGTIKLTHNIGAAVYIIDSSEIRPITHSLVKPGFTLYGKSQPYTAEKTVVLSMISPVSRAIAGLYYKPLPIDNFRANENNRHRPGDAVTFTWTYRVFDGNGNAAGEQLAGDPLDGTVDPDGHFELSIVGGRTWVISDGTCKVVYKNAEMIADFGFEPSSFTVNLKYIRGAYSTTSTIIVYRDTRFSAIDTTPPSPNPSTWDIEPRSISSSEIEMQATSATDDNGVEYYFQCVEGPGHDRDWSPNRYYKDSSLRDNIKYGYRVRTRDTSALQNTGEWSEIKYAYTDKADADITMSIPNMPGLDWTDDAVNKQVTIHSFQLIYKGVPYTIPETVLSMKVAYWNKNSSPSTLHMTNSVQEALGKEKFVIGINEEGVFSPAYGFPVLHAGLLQAGTIIAEKYGQLRNTIAFTAADSLDASHPFVVPFKIPSETTEIISARVSVAIQPYRAYSRTTDSRGGDVLSTTVSTDWSSWSETGAAGAATTSSGGSTTTSSAGRQNTSEHDIGSHSHTSSQHAHTLSVPSTTSDTNLGSHSHSTGSHEHSLSGSTASASGTSSHSHSLGYSASVSATTVDVKSTNLGSHSHGLGSSYNWDVDSTSVTVNSTSLGRHYHTIDDHTHTVGNHTHTIGNHTHALDDRNARHTHQVILPNHTHNFEYGIHQESNSPTVRHRVSNGSTYGPYSSTYSVNQSDIDIRTQLSGTGWKYIEFSASERCRLSVIIELKVDILA